MTDDLTRMRAKRIALAQTTDQIREAIRTAARFCPVCGSTLRSHSNEALDRCALSLEQPNQGA